MRTLKVDPTEVERLFRLEQSDAQIVAALGISKSLLKYWKRRLGLRRRTVTETTRERYRQLYRERCEAAGVNNLRLITLDKERQRRADVARRYNLPEDLTIAQVQVVVALATLGPQTTRGLVVACGRRFVKSRKPYESFKSRHTNGKNMLCDLRSRGLITFLDGGGKQGVGGRNEGLWWATAEAMQRLAQAKQGSE